MAESLSVPDIQKAQRICLDRGIPFFTYRLPGSPLIRFGAQISGSSGRFPGFSAGENGFLLSPFDSEGSVPECFIRNDIDLTCPDDLHKLESSGIRMYKASGPVGETDKVEYLSQAGELISVLKTGELRKAVLSRVLSVRCDALQEAPSWFLKMEEAYPGAFVFLVSVPGVTVWMGATPEIFLHQDASGLKTMSLAGTKRYDDTTSWGFKDCEEQQIVTEYIEDLFCRTTGIKPRSEGPYTHRAGKVSHLCTLFSLDTPLPPERVEALARKLHPTPAVGGFPREKAIWLIRRIENRSRRYYAGYLGPVYGDNQFDLFVNLRSMELFPDRMELYAGGGITALSDPESEWNETVMKSRTILDLTGNVG